MLHHEGHDERTCCARGFLYSARFRAVLTKRRGVTPLRDVQL